MTNPFAGIETSGGSFVKLKTPGESVTGIIVGLRKGLNFDKDKEVPEIVLNVDGEEQVLSCAPAVLCNWAVNNGEALAASVGQSLTVTFTGKDLKSGANLYTYVEPWAGAPAPQPAVAAVPAAAPSAAPQAAPVAAPVSPDAVA